MTTRPRRLGGDISHFIAVGDTVNAMDAVGAVVGQLTRTNGGIIGVINGRSRGWIGINETEEVGISPAGELQVPPLEPGAIRDVSLRMVGVASFAKREETAPR